MDSYDVLNGHYDRIQSEQRSAIETQRDELLAALKQIDALPSELAGEAWAIARAAIAKAEGAK